MTVVRQGVREPAIGGRRSQPFLSSLPGTNAEPDVRSAGREHFCGHAAPADCAVSGLVAGAIAEITAVWWMPYYPVWSLTYVGPVPTRVGGVLGGGVGLATGIVIALFPATALGGGLLLATMAGGALLGSVAGHAAAGMSRSDLKDLGESLDNGQAGLVVVGVSDTEAKVRAAMKHAQKVGENELKADQEALEAEAAEAEKS